ncbi:MAG: DUF4956 domain-containing protein [Bacteroidales bacterium]|nr:MAG: DUF4956 domain-containing protein [Bacteroidales bacterium]
MKTETILLLQEATKFLDIKLFETSSFIELIFRFLFNSLIVLTMVRYLYYPVARRKDYFFTYILVGTIVFLLCYALVHVDLNIGVALGLFALFGILRFRTVQLPIKEMTYLFMVIGISVINAMAGVNTSYAELLFINVIFLIVAWNVERFWMLRAENTKTIVYEKIDLVKPENRNLLIKDLEERTGLKINRIEIGRIDFIREYTRIRIHYMRGKGVDDHFEDLADDGD